MTILLSLTLLAALISLGLQCRMYFRLEKALKAKPIGRPRGSRNRPAQTLVDEAKTYFGPSVVKEAPSADEIAALIRYVNEGDIAARDEMIDPNDEFRTGTGYANT